MTNLWALRYSLHFLFIAFVASTPVRHRDPLLQRQYDVSIVTGVQSKDGNGRAPIRREVRDLRDNFPEQWNLYLLGLESLQGADQDDPLSYYGMASIHGRPYNVWGDAPGLSHKLGGSAYCPHNNALFLGWHRPYLALFEQVLHEHIEQLASKGSDKYKNAAKDFRIPYWDWARDESSGPVPEFLLWRNIDVIRPDGSKGYIRNPLYSYQFHPLVEHDFDSKWANIESTVRWPDSDNPESESRSWRFAQEFESQRRGVRDHVDGAFRQDNLNGFAVMVEEAHGWMHGVIGGGYANHEPKGHFWPLEYSAYEPLFMLHHANIDRLYAMYQAAHPDTHLEPSNVEHNGNVFLEDGQMVDGDTELLPFRKKSGEFWTTNSARDTETFGYTYPETQNGGDGGSSGVTAAISRLYSHSAKSLLVTPQATGGNSMSLDGNRTYTDWAITTTALTARLPSTFVVRFVFSSSSSTDSDVDVGTWMKLMPSSHQSNAATGKRASTLEASSQSHISITSGLLDQVSAGMLKSLDPTDVVPFLKEKLNWRVFTGDGNQLGDDILSAFTFEVVSTQARVPDGVDAPIEYSKDITTYPEVTAGKLGGVTA